MLDLRELLLQRLLRQAGQLDALAERTTGGQRHLHGEIALIQGRDELRTQAGEEPQAGRQRQES